VDTIDLDNGRGGLLLLRCRCGSLGDGGFGNISCGRLVNRSWRGGDRFIDRGGRRRRGGFTWYLSYRFRSNNRLNGCSWF
jgi:hypothetical protein